MLKRQTHSNFTDDLNSNALNMNVFSRGGCCPVIRLIASCTQTAAMMDMVGWKDTN